VGLPLLTGIYNKHGGLQGTQWGQSGWASLQSRRVVQREEERNLKWTTYRKLGEKPSLGFGEGFQGTMQERMLGKLSAGEGEQKSCLSFKSKGGGMCKRRKKAENIIRQPRGIQRGESAE